MNRSEPVLANKPFNDAWIQRVGKGLDPAGCALLREAADWADKALTDQLADTGEPLAAHAAGAALILADIGADAQARAAAVLTMLPQSPGRQPHADVESVRKAFGPAVATLVQGARTLLRLGHIAGTAAPQGGPHGQDQKEMRRKMLLAMAADLRIVVMRLASRLQSLRWHAAEKVEYPPALARETMELYTPLANRLGIWQLKWEMEDLAFRFTHPDVYRSIARQLEDKRIEREALIEEAVQRLEELLAEAHISARVYGRPKHIYSIWNKMRLKRIEFHELYDLRALRVIVADERSCYAALALVHSTWTPLADEFDDYISRPKPNGYRSLHTVVADQKGRSFEIQIRTEEMHHFAEYGMAAHWLYKESGSRGGQAAAASTYDQKLAWMRQLLSWDGEAPANAADAGAPPTAAEERIYVMTPQARVIELPAGATPVDFAYHLHTDLGHRCRGARVDGQMVPLSTPLQTGQIVEIIAAKSGGPSRDWLNTQLGFLASPRARSKVRAWFNAIELQQRIAHGQTVVEKELQRLGKTAVSMENMAQQLGFARADDLYVAVSKEEFSLRQIDYLLSGQKARDEQQEGDDPAKLQLRTSEAASPGKSGVLVVGVDSLMTQLARCCRPAPPDAIRGFVTRGRGVSIHRSDCPSYAALAQRQPERLIEVTWGDTGDTLYPVDISIHAQERPNLLRDLSEVFAKLRINVISVNTQSRRSLAHMVFTIEVRSGEQTTRALTALNELTGVQAERT